MHLQVLANGSAGNSILVRAGETHVLLDAGLPIRELQERLSLARVSPTRIDHIVLTHGHLDHARSAGTLAKQAGARVHCAPRLMRSRSVRKAPRIATLPIGGTTELTDERGRDPIRLTTVRIPHDAEPTVALALEAGGRRALYLTDMGHEDAHVARRLGPAHVVVLESNHDHDLLQRGPYPPKLKERIAGPRGHLSNDESAGMLRRLAHEELHTLVLVHLSTTNNTPELAGATARRTLDDMGRGDVRLLLPPPSEVGENLEV